jgi:hypothetical protein
MGDLLKGNLKIKKSVDSPGERDERALKNRFEKEALKKYGGSIAFVSKKVLWGEKDFNCDKLV